MSGKHVYVLAAGRWWRVLSCGCCVRSVDYARE